MTGVLSTGPAEVIEAAARIYAQGGNAFDAAAAACLACAVIEPQAVDLGGYVLAGVVLEGSSDRIWSIDANSVAPAATTPTMYEVLPRVPGKIGINELEYDCTVRDDANVYGPLAVGVPGFLGGVGTLHERWGTLPWAAIVAEAQHLVRTALTDAQIRKDLDFKREPMARYAAHWDRRDLALTLARLSSAGWRDFYDGKIGHAIADHVQATGGILTRADMAAFEPRITEPYSGAYHGAEIHTAIPPNGGYSVLDALPEFDPPADALAYWDYLAALLQRLWERRLGPSPTATHPNGTIHISAADRNGNLASLTISQGGLFGACVAVPNTGIILAHGMCRFDPHPGLPNSPAPGHRPLNNVCPMIIRTPHRDIAIGARGGRRIISVAVHLAHEVVDRNASPQDACTTPLLHVLTRDPVEVSRDFDPEIRAALEARGHQMKTLDPFPVYSYAAEISKPDRQLRAGGSFKPV